MRSCLSLLAGLLGLLAATDAGGGYGWRGGDFPGAGSPACNSESEHAVCDPDRILSPPARQRLAERLRALERSGTPCGDAGVQPFEFGVALVDSLEDARGMQTFTEEVFDSWGVGHRSCNNGVVFALSKRDRENYIKTGKGARPFLSDGHAAAILDSIKKELRAGDYDGAVEKAVGRVIDEALVGPFGGLSFKGALVALMGVLLVPALFAKVLPAWCCPTPTEHVPVNPNNPFQNPYHGWNRRVPRRRGGGGGGGGGGGFGGGGGGGGGGARGGW